MVLAARAHPFPFTNYRTFGTTAEDFELEKQSYFNKREKCTAWVVLVTKTGFCCERFPTA
jgi:hypothetical protein